MSAFTVREGDASLGVQLLRHLRIAFIGEFNLGAIREGDGKPDRIVIGLVVYEIDLNDSRGANECVAYPNPIFHRWNSIAAILWRFMEVVRGGRDERRT